MTRGPRRTHHRERERRDPEATRQALLRAGAELFAERGFDGVPIDEVAARAGVNKALISYHFRGKRGLYVAILESTFAETGRGASAIDAEARERPRRPPGASSRPSSGSARERPGLPHPLHARGPRRGDRARGPAPPPRDRRGHAAARRARGARGPLPAGRPASLPPRPRGQPRLLLRHRARPAEGGGRDPRAASPCPRPAAFLRYLEELTLRGLAPEARGRPSPREAVPSPPQRSARMKRSSRALVFLVRPRPARRGRRPAATARTRA